MAIEFRLQDAVEGWFDTVDPKLEVSAQSIVIKLIEECTELLRALDDEARTKEMADILICAFGAAHRLNPFDHDMNVALWAKLDENKERTYYVVDGQLMRQKDGRDH